VSTSGRVAYEVAGQSQKYYLCLLDVGYCNCAYFAHNGKLSLIRDTIYLIRISFGF
jgi:hypothetical protein